MTAEPPHYELKPPPMPPPHYADEISSFLSQMATIRFVFMPILTDEPPPPPDFQPPLSH
jgi:hypothetical protein